MITKVDNPMSFVHSEHFMNYSSAVSCLASVALESQHNCGQTEYTSFSRTERLPEEAPRVNPCVQLGSLRGSRESNSRIEETCKSLDGLEESRIIYEEKSSGGSGVECNLRDDPSELSTSNVLQTMDKFEYSICHSPMEEHKDNAQYSYTPGCATKDNHSSRTPNFCSLEPIFSMQSSGVQDTSIMPIFLYRNQFPSNSTVYDTVSWTQWFHPSFLSSSAWKIPNTKSRECHTVPWNETESKVSCNDLYKTELCRSFMETGFCRYHSKCQFAHGVEELRPVKRHPKYKTRLCKNFVENGTCPYGSRCRFIHGSSGASSFEGLQTDLLLAVQGISLGKERRHSRLPVFQTLEEKSDDIHTK
ncbi:hypothetical protein GpartN1_g3999.t1 [Galdieria partita]|uniref:C3H1-type domain-containing protein n=1 Tax=Galdieria partita TaxID=83374 RepID=A0A9C7PWN4_9RHOD|nr:hypothetical protein GpartN1_g3999.t1 [Galdieria partita]